MYFLPGRTVSGSQISSIAFLVDVVRLQNAVDYLIQAPWQMHYQTLHYFGEWSAIPLRTVDGRTVSIIVSSTGGVRYADTLYFPNATYLQTVLQSFCCPLQSVILLKLCTGVIIKEDREAELDFLKRRN